MKNAVLIVLVVVNIILLAAVVAMWNDDRHLKAQIIDKVGGCVAADKHAQLIDTCASLSDINRRDQAALYRFREAVYGRGEDERRPGDDQVWRAARHVDKGGDTGRRGRGGGP